MIFPTLKNSYSKTFSLYMCDMRAWQKGFMENEENQWMRVRACHQKNWENTFKRLVSVQDFSSLRSIQ